jgi:hypothetical protein
MNWAAAVANREYAARLIRMPAWTTNLCTFTLTLKGKVSRARSARTRENSPTTRHRRSSNVL